MSFERLDYEECDLWVDRMDLRMKPVPQMLRSGLITFLIFLTALLSTGA